MALCSPDLDDTFGPAITGGCRQNFDFTLLFEQTLLQSAPAALLLIAAPLRAAYLYRQDVKVPRTAGLVAKQAAIALQSLTQLALLVCWTLPSSHRTRASIPAVALSFLACLSLLPLSSLEHERSIRPSTIINGWILLSVLLDVPQARTLFLRPGSTVLPALFTLAIALKVVILFLEAQSKRKSISSARFLHAAPEDLANLYARATVWWINKLLLAGYQDLLSTDKLPDVEADLHSEVVYASLEAEWRKHSATSERVLWRVLFFTARLNLLGIVVPRLCLSAFRLSQPLLISRITTLLEHGIDTNNDKNRARGLIAAAACVYTGIAITKAMYSRGLHRLLIRLRSSLIAALYANAMRLDSYSLKDSAILALVSADVTRICNSLKNLDQLFAAPIEIGVAIYLLQLQVGVSALATVALVVALTGIGLLGSSWGVEMQKEWLAHVSKRVSYTSTVIGLPKAFKMLGLEDYFIDRIQHLRELELAEMVQYRKYVAWRNVLGVIPVQFAPPLTLTILTFVNRKEALNPTSAFTTLALVALLTLPTMELMHAFPQFLTAMASLDRVEAFLRRSTLLPQTIANVENSDGEEEISLEGLKPSIALSSHDEAPCTVRLLSASVNAGAEDKPVLRNITLNVQQGKMTVIIGPVGCGKSTLLKTLIGDLDLSHGHRTISPEATFAYCSQEPWLPNETVRSTIVQHATFDTQWYGIVVGACVLVPDVERFDKGHDTMVGALSGGQRQRVALARALYSNKRVLVVDDIFRGLDGSTSRQLFARVFGPLGLCKARGITVLMASHSVQFLPEVDFVVFCQSDGTIAEQGTYEPLRINAGRVSQLPLMSEEGGTAPTSGEAVQNSREMTTLSRQAEAALAEQDLARRTGDRTVFLYYLKFIGLWPCLFAVTAAATCAFGEKFADIWFKWWANAESGITPTHYSLGYYIGIAFLLAFTACAAQGALIWNMTIVAASTSSARLHKQLLKAVIRATYKFFIETDPGVTLNRFSNDMSIIESELIVSFMQFCDGATLCIAAAVLIFIGSRYSSAALVFALVVIYLVQRFYLRTSRQLRLLELEAQAPLLTHCRDTLTPDGVTSIRAFGWQHSFFQECTRLLDRSQRSFYLMLCIQRWLNLVLSLITAATATLVVALALTMPATSSAGAIGVSLLGVVSFSSQLSFLVEAWTMLETSLGAVARCKNFVETLPTDVGKATVSPPSSWPTQGTVEFKKVTASYNADKEVLRNVTLSISAGEKVGICGRSGSGKSSLLLTMFRLLDIQSAGSIEIDGIDVSTLPLQDLRQGLTAIPQEILIYPGSIYTNLDPLGRSSIDIARKALQKVNLQELANGTLDAEMTSLSLTPGQLQLFAIARALLRPTKVLVLDEISSSTDDVTEEFIIRLVKEEFRASTIIAVAHRLKTIIDFDRVVVIDNGSIVEVGPPRDLLRQENSIFRRMWDE